ncbi:Fe(3+) ABC transporter substrate-binding protein [Methylonatrum kenyense]|uniref:Fe(3+) ABC transporter substrate-binding protein n=1 Tax=Methylonatrum kenyense TaxID=455253 RepID=UPI0020BFAF7F|nr:Fe(3+) ABC transporter substrate-binding protein [Methylonatrum kenyense]MCK8516579.1 Fe(3+) ABC transporter substrate-binding protein [Methylonatrum kenyense]
MRVLLIVGLVAAAVLGVSFWASQQSGGQGDEIIVYSARQEHLIKPLFDRFTEETGMRVRYVTDDAGPLLQRLRAEGANTRADMLMTVDAGNLWQAAEQDVLASIESDTLERNVPANLRDPDGRWFGLSVRARTIVYSTERVDPEDLSTYEALADDQWDGRLCLRTSKKVYNQSLVATMIARHGEELTEEIVSGWVDNLATQPFSNDTAVMEAIVAGQCDVGIVNTYYFGRLQERDGDETPLALFWPNQDAEGVHVNVSGAGITRHASNPEAALQLLEWLSEQEAQEMFGALNMEYPVRPETEWTERVRGWGEFQGDDIDVSEAGRRQVDAVMLMDRVGYR